MNSSDFRELASQATQFLIIFKAVTVSCSTFHLYYAISHLDEEIEYVWTKRWTVGKIIYLLTRYLGSIFLILASSGTIFFQWGSDDLFVIKDNGITFKNHRAYLFGKLYTGLGTMIILLAEVVLMMRVYALFGGAIKSLVAFVLFLLTLLLFGFNVLQTSLDLTKQDIGSTIANNDLGNGYGSLVEDRMSGIAWTVTAFVELLLFLLVLWKIMHLERSKPAMRVSRSGSSKTQDITILMARDSIIYFAIIFSICLLGVILTFSAEKTSGNLNKFFYINSNAYQTVVITIMTILAPKMLVNLRAEYYGPVGILATELSWDVRNTSVHTETISRNE